MILCLLEYPTITNLLDNYHVEFFCASKGSVEDIAKNVPRIEALIDQLNPDKIMVFGRNLSLLFTSVGLEESIQNEYDYKGIKLLTNFHPFVVKNNQSLLRIFESKFHGEIPKAQTPYEIIYDYKVALDKCLQTGYCAFDFETINFEGESALEWYRESTVPSLISISFQPGFSYIVPLYHPESLMELHEEFFKDFIELFYNESMTMMAHNKMYDLHFFVLYGLDLRKIKAELNDTMLMHHLLDENTRHRLKELAKEYFPGFTDYDKDIKFDGPLDILSAYAAIDTDLCFRFYILFKSRLIDEGLYSYYRNYTMAVFKPLFKASHYGTIIDVEAIDESLATAAEYAEDKMKEMKSFPEFTKYIKLITERAKLEAIEECNNKLAEVKIKKQEKIDKATEKFIKEPLKKNETALKKAQEFVYVDEVKFKDRLKEIKLNFGLVDFNFKSTKQLADFLFTKEGLGLKPPKIDGVVSYSTSREALESFHHPFLDLLFQYRTIEKMMSTYYLGIKNSLDSENKLHSNFNLAGTVTGRISSSEPNLQNIPVRLPYKDEKAWWCIKQVKKFFIVPEDYTMVQVDYSQAELRIIANMSDDRAMKDAYINGEDLHLKTALQIHKMTKEQWLALPEDQQKAIRQDGKPSNFGWVYKASEEGYMEFAKNNYGITLTREQATEHKNAIFNTYPNIGVWHTLQELTVKKKGYVTTLFGRKRRLPEIYSDHPGKHNQAVRQSINAPVQGSCGEFNLFTAAILDLILPDYVWFINNVHDSLYYLIPTSKLSLICGVIKTIGESDDTMISYFKEGMGEVKMALDFEISDKNWGEMTKYIF